jgi:hypothetical protein
MNAPAYLDQIYASDPEIDRGYAARIARLLQKINGQIVEAMTAEELSADEADQQITAAASELAWFARALRFANQTAKNVQRVESGPRKLRRRIENGEQAP